ncbi:MAG: hypothetical protein IT377_12110 [Polyangiaceae bacterium]|nr:hypothetical protein [Polyangiaceae bacterium]
MRIGRVLSGGLLMVAWVGCGGGSVTPGMVTAAQRRWPETSREELERGQATFAAKCKECHALPSPRAHTADEWVAITRKMGKLAGLDAPSSQSVLRYVTAAREGE